MTLPRVIVLSATALWLAVGACDRSEDASAAPKGHAGHEGEAPPPAPADAAAPKGHAGHGGGGAAGSQAIEGPDDEIAWWTCPMHTSVRQPGPGSCPICGMTLKAVTKGEVRSGSVLISPERRALAGVELAAAEMRPMRSTLRVVAFVTWDQERLADVTLKVDGYVREAWIQATGERVRKGQPLFSLYSPELLVAQEELLAAVVREREGDPTAAERAAAARRRLRLWDLTDEQIDGMLRDGRSLEEVPVLSPASGWVIEEEIVEGAAVERGMRLYRIGDLGEVWIEAQVPEQDAARIRVGDPVRVTVPHLDAPREGTVARVLPQLDEMTRTATVRIALDNAGDALQPNQWATVDIDFDDGVRLAVPESAVLYTGPRRLVFVDTGGDRLTPREVKIGPRADGWVAIEEGLVEGDRVVVSGNFEVGADSRIQGGGGTW